MRTVTFLQPNVLVFGKASIMQAASDLASRTFERVLLVTSPPLVSAAEPFVEALGKASIRVSVFDEIDGEPTIEDFERALCFARKEDPEAIVALGGGSVMDVGKLVAALVDGTQDVRELFGINLLKSRSRYLLCLPTTSGTGSEVSPNAILLDEQENLKKGVVSRFLVPDAAYVDSQLTYTVPPALTAATGMDALTHCIEGYTNKYAHPMVDLYALEGIRLIGAHLQRAVEDGGDEEARENVALGSLYGGLCLGPVNTAGVHVLSYPLGGEFHIPHGLSNAVLLPFVCEFNLSAAPERYARVAQALGVKPAANPEETARLGIQKLRELSRRCGTLKSLSELGIPRSAILHLAEAAMKVTRLLKNNPRELTIGDAVSIYQAAYE